MSVLSLEGRNKPGLQLRQFLWLVEFLCTPKLDIRKRFHFSCRITYGPKIFFSGRPEDINHFGRRDASWTEDVSFRMDLNPDFEFRIKYERTGRSANRNGVDLEFPNFHQNVISTGVFYEY